MNLHLFRHNKKSSTFFNIYLCQLVFLALLEVTEGSWIWPNFVSGNRRVTRQASRKCTEEQFKCKNGACIPTYNICDGTKDCSDGSDEIAATCSTTLCPDYTFRCDYGACLSKESKCNGKVECPDGSDESKKYCGKSNSTDGEIKLRDMSKCSSEEMQCKSGACIKSIFKCDGTRHCEDGSDETKQECSMIQCPGYTFRCDYGACVDGNAKCDGKQDCADNSDESSLICVGSIGPVEPPDPTVTDEPIQTVKPPKTPKPDTTSVTPGSCKVPSNTRDKKFKIVCELGSTDKHCQAIAGTYVPSATSIRFTCNSGYATSTQSTEGDSGNQAWCIGGNWIPAVKNCTKICQNLNTNNMKISCPLNFGSKCESILLAGTVLKPECIDSNYRPEVPPTYSQIYCREDGTWDRQLFTCVPVCGVKSSDVGTLIVDGKKEVSGDSPWHVAIYRKADKLLICGGTIVTEFIIISAAHCFYNTATDTISPIANYDIMVSKYTRTYSKPDNPYSKVYELRNIFLPDGSYHDAKDSYTNDIVVLETKEKMVLSPYVAPACVEWTRSKKFNPPEGTVGKVVGWGATGNSTTSDELLAADLPYSSPVSCREKVDSSLRRYITQDKFCAGNFTGAAVRKGDSGGGWLVPVQPYNLYNLYGVVSNNLGGLNSISSFTDIIQHIDWLNSVKSSIEKRKIEEQIKIGMKTR